MYLLDANVLIEANETYYPIDRLPQFWDWLITMAAAGEVKMPFEIHEEISPQPGLFKNWLSDAGIKKALILDEAVDNHAVAHVVNAYGGPLTDSDTEKMGRAPFLIAYGLIHADRIIVTKEISRPSAQKGNRKIPDVCNDVGVKWIRDFEMYKILNFTLAGK